MPWRFSPSPYRVLVSEIMLQQTGISRVMAKYGAFLRAFPSLRRLAQASVADVLAAWKGLGYNRRALALLKTARIICENHRGRVPRSLDELVALPGIGQATASAVLVYAFNMPVAFIETNVRRVFLHFFFPGETQVSDARILPLVESTMDRENPREWFYALMDYGTMLAAAGENANTRSARLPETVGIRRIDPSIAREDSRGDACAQIRRARGHREGTRGSGCAPGQGAGPAHARRLPS